MQSEGYTSNTFLISTTFLGVLQRMAAESKSKSIENEDIMNIIDLLSVESAAQQRYNLAHIPHCCLAFYCFKRESYESTSVPALL